MSQNPLTIYYLQFTDTILPGTPLQDQEIQFIAMCIGYPIKLQIFTDALIDLTVMQLITIRQAIVEIIRLDDLLKDSIKAKQVLKVEDITMNNNYSGELRDELATEVKKLSRLLGLPIIDNLYVSSDDVQAYITADGQIVRKRDSGASYLTAWMSS